MMRLIALLAAAVALLALPAAPAGAVEAAPALSLTSLATPTAFIPNDSSGEYTYDLRVANLGGAATDGSDIVLTDTLPAGLGVTAVEMKLRSFNPGGIFDYGCAGHEECFEESLPCHIEEDSPGPGVQTVTCTISDALPQSREPALLEPGEERRLLIHLTPGAIGEGEILTNHLEVQGGGSPPASIDVDNVAATEEGGEWQPAPPGLSFFHAGLTGPDGQPVTRAAAHPYQLTLGFAVNNKLPGPGSQALVVPAGGDLRDVRAVLPPGLVGNPNALPRCPARRFNELRPIDVNEEGFTAQWEASECPASSTVGVILVQEIEGAVGALPIPLYNLVPPPGMPAQLGAQILGVPFYFNTEVLPDHRYAIVAGPHNLTQGERLVAATAVIWGDPADESHDPLRGACVNSGSSSGKLRISYCEEPFAGEGGPFEGDPFLRAPTNCSSPLEIAMQIETWSAISYAGTDSHPAMEGCEGVPFEPTLQARPSTDVADSPSGLHADLHLPQEEAAEPEEGQQGTADLRKALVTLPEGLVLNPSAANGLGSCSETQIGYLGKDEGGVDSFNGEPAECPDSSRVGSVKVHTPLIDHVLQGSVYIATSHANPFDSLAAIYIDVEDPLSGIVVKLPGHVEPDPSTGRLTTSFDENPQVPFEDFELDFFGGPAAPLRTPALCGEYSTDSTLTPWSAPASGPPVRYSDHYSIERSPGGGTCPTEAGELPNSPSFEAGTEAPIAGATSPMVIRLAREDDSQEFSSLTLTTPPGLLARLAGIPYCPDSALAAAAAKSGHAEQADPSCPAASRVGTVDVAAGAGPAPYWTKAAAYLTGPYKGAPLSLVVIAPAAAGPYDLGTVVVRSALHVDPETARITALTDPLPHILQGIPLDVRQVVVHLDHPGWALNPTSCNPFSFDGRLISTLGFGAALSSRFQVGECGRLAFKPQLRLRLKGKTNRTGFPALHAVYTPKPGEANLRSLVLRFPRSEFIEQGHFRTICTRVQFAAEACPAGSVYGHIRAFTPLLDDPLEGPVYLRSSNHNLPDVVFDLHGQIPVVVAVRIDSIKGGLRAGLENAPDASISKVVLDMQGGQKGLFVNSRNLCVKVNRASANFTGQNGKVYDTKPVLKADCGKASKKHKVRHERHKHHQAKKRHARKGSVRP
jgi:hypothetical protein